MKVSALGSQLRGFQGDQRGHDTGGFNPRDGAAYRSEQPGRERRTLGARKPPVRALKKGPAIRDGNAKSDTVLQFTQSRPRASVVAATLSVRQHRCLAAFHYVKLYTGRGRTRSCDVKPGQY
jgi:hypothetical protein